ncbi:DUF3794 domain-containing protein [Thermoanaerobacterium sp. DL9XJH110]|uniref:DUF3794 domain-containing protein n=1 Tax=Thermoanaerobacterium sp. DL9XJH110 TaxID=3386643 RepID=UPI003BB7144A
MELFRTEEILWEKVYTKELKQDIKLKPCPANVTDVVSKVKDADHRIQKGAVVVSATLAAVVYFSGREGTLRCVEVRRPVRYVFYPEKVLDGMEVRVACVPEIRQYHLAEDTLSVDFLLNFRLEAVIERPAAFAKTLEARTGRIATFRVIKEETDVAGITGFFEKSDCRRIIAVRPHMDRVEARVLKGLVAVEGEISADVFYVDGAGLEKHGQIFIPLERVIPCDEAEPEHLARVTAAFSDVHCRPSLKAGYYGIMMACRLKVKVLKKEESLVVTDFEQDGYQVVKEELLLKEVIGQGEFSFLIEEICLLKPPVNNLVDLYGRVEGVSCEIKEGLLVVQGIMGVEVFYVGENLLSAYRYVEINFCRSHPAADVDTAVSYELKPRILHLSGVLKDGGLEIRALVEIGYTAVCRRSTPAVVDIIPREGIERELFRVEKIMETKTIDLMEKNEIVLDYPVKLVEDIKGEVENLSVTVLDHRFLIQGGLAVHVYYAGADGVVRCRKNLVPFGVLGDVRGGREDMQVQVNARITEVSGEIVGPTRLDTVFLLSFDVEATCQEDLYLVTGAPDPSNRRYRQVFVEERTRRLSHIMPLAAPALFAKDVTLHGIEKWMEADEAGFWVGGRLRVNAAYVGRDHLVHQDIDELEFRFYIKGRENLDASRVDVAARPRKVVLAAGGEMLESEFEISIKNYYFKNG